jgi:hypothetical protein
MKLSEAILLGSTVLAPQAGRQYSSETKSGCALGMAAIAKGATFHQVRPINEYDRRTLGTEDVWGTWVLMMARRPCDCWRLLVPREMRIKDIIAHTFDYHVMRKKNWTLEQLVEWVKTVEPDDVPPPQPVVWAQPGEVIRRRPLAGQQIQPSLDEVQEWLTVRQAFLAGYHTRRRRHSART